MRRLNIPPDFVCMLKCCARGFVSAFLLDVCGAENDTLLFPQDRDVKAKASIEGR